MAKLNIYLLWDLRRLNIDKLSIKTAIGFLVTAIFVTNLSYSDTVKLEDDTTLSLVGIGIAQEYRNDIYIGALYTQGKQKTPDDILDPDIAKRMSIRFLANSYSPNQVSRYWKQRIAMNNDPSSWKPFTKHIIRLSRIFTDSFVKSGENYIKGDEINFDYLPGQGTKVYINGQFIQAINKKDFYPLLLKTWLGSVPPTKAFQSGILGETKASKRKKTLKRFSTLLYTPGRFKAKETRRQVASNTPRNNRTTRPSRQNTSTRSNRSTKPSTQSNNNVPKNTTTEATPKSTKNTTPIVAQVDKKPPVTKKEDKPSNTAKPPVKPSVQKGQPEKTASTTKTDKNKQIADNSKLKILQPIEAVPTPADINPVEEQSIEQQPVTEDNFDIIEAQEDIIDLDLILGAYNRQVIKKVRKNTIYPSLALSEGDEGDGVAQVILNRKGELVDVNITTKTGSRILDRAIIKMIKRSSPFKEIPTELTGEQFEFDIPISFKIEKN